MKKKACILLLLISSLMGCATYEPETNSYTDPLSGINNVIFDFNYYALDPYILRPVAIVWKDYLPSPIRNGFVNFSSNLTEPASIVNSLLQGELREAGIHVTRFFLNTVFGLAGIFDVASIADPDLNIERRTLGNVLGSYDVPYGPFVILPFYGQATLREDGGVLVDNLYSPLALFDWKLGLLRSALDAIESRAAAIDYESLLEQTDDPYNFMRNAYFQRHDFEALNHKVDESKQEQRENVISSFINDIDSL